jgi:glycosyltransferase involved in cell wall biosynthesis
MPVFFRGDSTLLDEQSGFSVKKMLRRIFLRWVYRHIDKALYTGEANKKYYQAHGVNGDKLVYAPHAIDNKRFQHNEEESINKAVEWRKKLMIPVEAIILLFAGKLESKKNPQLLLEVFLELNNPAVHLIIAGNGELESQLKQLSANHPRIHFIGFQNQEQMPVVYRMADIFILPSGGPGETWGLAINEAMACARPVIVSDACGGSNDLVIQDKNGLIVQRNNKEDLKKAIQQLIVKQKIGLQAMGKNSLEHVQHFSLEVVADGIENALLRK